MTIAPPRRWSSPPSRCSSHSAERASRPSVNVPDNSVGTAKIEEQRSHDAEDQEQRRQRVETREQAVTSAKIAGNAVTNAKIANGTIQPADLSAAAKTSGPAGAPGPQGPSGPAGARQQRAGRRLTRSAISCATRAPRLHEERDRFVPGDLQPGRDGLHLPVVAWWTDHRPPSSRTKVGQPSCRTSLPVYACSPRPPLERPLTARSSLPSSANGATRPGGEQLLPTAAGCTEGSPDRQKGCSL